VPAFHQTKKSGTDRGHRFDVKNDADEFTRSADFVRVYDKTITLTTAIFSRLVGHMHCRRRALRCPFTLQSTRLAPGTWPPGLRRRASTHGHDAAKIPKSQGGNVDFQLTRFPVSQAQKQRATTTQDARLARWLTCCWKIYETVPFKRSHERKTPERAKPMKPNLLAQ
jgi:hypothetical protein